MDFFSSTTWLPKRTILGRNMNLKGSQYLLSIYSLELPMNIFFKFSGFKLHKGFSGKSHILSTHIDHALMRKCHMWDASHIAHLQFRGKLDVMSIMIITRTHFYLHEDQRTKNGFKNFKRKVRIFWQDFSISYARGL